MNDNPLRVLGVDHGLNRTGYGLIAASSNQMQCLDFGVIETDADQPFHMRLQSIYQALTAIIAQWTPEVMAVEEAIYAQNVRTALLMGHARGAVLLAGAHAGLSIQAYPPKKIKMAVTGYGNASKEQVQFMVTRLLRLTAQPCTFDVTDALAVAICHLHQQRGRG